MRSDPLVLALWLTAACSVPAPAGEALPWPEKDGPTRTGMAAAGQIAGLPLTWNEETGENVAWKVFVEGKGHSTPVVGRGRVWFTSATEDGTRQTVYGIDALSGKVLHHKLLFENEDPEPLGNPMNTYASPTCVLEADALYAHFGTYGTARLDPATGEAVWQRRDIHCRHFRGPGSSPVVCGELLILTFDGIDRQFLIALDKRTGRTRWQTNRSTDYHDLGPDGLPIGEGDYRKAFGTPGLVEVAGRMQLVSVGSRAAFGYDALTGEELWTIPHDDYNAAIRPLFFEGLALVNTGSRDADLFGIRLDATTRGDITSTHVAWLRDKGNADLQSPVLTGGRLYMVTGTGVLYCLDARTGEELWGERLGGSYVASPVGAGDRIYLCDTRGRSVVVRASGEFELLAESQLSEGMYATPAVAGGALYLRTFTHLYRIAAP